MHVFVPGAGVGVHAEPASHAPGGAFASAHPVASRANGTGSFAPPVGGLHEPTGESEVRIAFASDPVVQYVTAAHDVPLSATLAH